MHGRPYSLAEGELFYLSGDLKVLLLLLRHHFLFERLLVVEQGYGKIEQRDAVFIRRDLVDGVVISLGLCFRAVGIWLPTFHLCCLEALMSVHELTQIEQPIFVGISILKNPLELLPCTLSSLAFLPDGVELCCLCEYLWCPCQNLVYIALDKSI